MDAEDLVVYACCQAAGQHRVSQAGVSGCLSIVQACHAMSCHAMPCQQAKQSRSFNREPSSGTCNEDDREGHLR